MRLGFAPTALQFTHVSDEEIDRIAKVGKCAIAGADRELFRTLFAENVASRRLTANAPNAVKVRKYLVRFAKYPEMLPFPALNSHEWKAREMILNNLERREVRPPVSAAEVAISVEACVKTIKSYTKRGRETDAGDLGNLFTWADYYERLGGKPSSAWDEGTQSRRTPFVRFLLGIGEAMPADIGRPFIRGLEDRVRRVLMLRKSTTIRDDFDQNDFSP